MPASDDFAKVHTVSHMQSTQVVDIVLSGAFDAFRNLPMVCL